MKYERKLDLGSRIGRFWGILDFDLDPRFRSKSRVQKRCCPSIAGKDLDLGFRPIIGPLSGRAAEKFCVQGQGKSSTTVVGISDCVAITGPSRLL
jgi:hypothetical protein